MGENSFKKPKNSHFENPDAQKSFVDATKTADELLQKELFVNQSEQLLLQKRILMTREFLNDLPASDPQYAMLAAQMRMDQIELDELNVREAALKEQLKT